MFMYLVLMLGVLLSSTAAQDSPGDHQCGPGQEQCLQNSVERMRCEINAMQADLRRVIKENQKLSTEIQKGKECMFYLFVLLNSDQVQRVHHENRFSIEVYDYQSFYQIICILGIIDSQGRSVISQWLRRLPSDHGFESMVDR